MCARTDNLVPVGSIGASKLIRTWVGLSLPGDVADVEPYDISSAGSDIYLASLDLEVSPQEVKQGTTESDAAAPCLRLDSGSKRMRRPTFTTPRRLESSSRELTKGSSSPPVNYWLSSTKVKI